MKWCDSVENLRDLAYWLNSKDVKLDTLHFLEKPWHYESEWNQFQEECYTSEKIEQEKELKI